MLLGSLWESDNHRIILLPVIGWPISEQGRVYVPRVLAVGLPVNNNKGVTNYCQIVPHFALLNNNDIYFLVTYSFANW